MKKLFVITTALLVSVSAFANLPTLTCKASNGDVLVWDPNYGELEIEDKHGVSIGNMDALVLGKTKFIETYPARRITPIEYGDEEEGQVYAEIVTVGKKTNIELRDQVFHCTK